MSAPWSGPEADWVRSGSALFARALESLPDDELRGSSGLPGWTRAHVVAHVSANAQAIGRLLHWARSGEVTPMYPSIEERDHEIQTGSQLGAVELRAWFAGTDNDLLAAFQGLPEQAWDNTVVTAQGREVPASETLWMRSREVCIHAVDLDAGGSYAELPTGFLLRLIDEAVARHSVSDGALSITIDTPEEHRWQINGAGNGVRVEGSVPAVAQWLTGRGDREVHPVGGPSIPLLGKWL